MQRLDRDASRHSDRSWPLASCQPRGPSSLSKKAASGRSATADAPIETFTGEQKSHWAYQPLKRPDVPSVRESSWIRNPIDRFLLAELESVDLPHAPEADRIALIRRLTYDLTGLPPSLGRRGGVSDRSEA